jgi:sec-independent protein translocase protein TatC
MGTALRPVGHEDRLSIVEHLDELRSRLIICLIALVVAFAVAFWQNGRLLDILNEPLEKATTEQVENASTPLAQQSRLQRTQRQALAANAALYRSLAREEGLSAALRAPLLVTARANEAAVRAIPLKVEGRQPVTLSIGEPFTQTVLVALWFALLIAMPVVLWQLYAFLMPAFTPQERRVALPLMWMIPVLFLCGVTFGYFIVLPAAIGFLQNFNAGEFDVLVQARSYYQFALMSLLGVGLLFQVPVGVLALTRSGVLTTQQLRKNRRYAIVIIAVAAMLLPGVDPVTMLIEMVPLLLLYELSIVCSAVLDRASRKSSSNALDPADPDPL